MQNIFNWSRNTQGRFLSTILSISDLTPKQLIAHMDRLYENNDLYKNDEYSAYWNPDWMEAMKPLRTCVHRSVEFYVARIAQGEPVITAGNEAILEPIQTFLKDSNFISTKPLALRGLALYGDLFEKVEFDGEKVYKSTLDLKTVTSFAEDSRGFITEIRIDVPLAKDEGVRQFYTEYWTLEAGGYVATWTHKRDEETPLEQLGEPDTYTTLGQLGIDFIPIKHTKFIDTGKDRGTSCTAHALKKIDEVNRKATRLAQMQFRFNKPLFGVTTGRDDEGRPLPVPKLKTSSTAASSDTEKGNTEDGTFIYIPGADIKDLVPKIQYADALAILQADEEELKQDLPELRYYSLKESDLLSGVAIRTLLAGALDRAEEAQTNFIESQKRLIQMALTIGKNRGIYPRNIGSYEDGSFEFDLDFGEIMPAQSNNDRADMLKTLTDGGVPLEVAMKIAGYPDEVVQEAAAQAEAAAQKRQDALATSMLNFNRA